MLEFDASKVVAKKLIYALVSSKYYSLSLKVITTLGYVIEIRLVNS